MIGSRNLLEGRKLLMLSVLLLMVSCLNSCGHAVEPTDINISTKPIESNEPSNITEIKAPVLPYIPNIIGLLKKTPEEVNQLLGDEATNFKADPANPVIMMSDVYEIEGLSLKSINLCYTSSDYIITSLSPDINTVSYQEAGNDTGVQTLNYAEYVFHYDTADEAEKIWNWVCEQKETLTGYFGRVYDFEYGISSYQTIKSMPETESKDGGISWMLDVEGSDKINHKVTYYDFIRITDTEIIVCLSVNESYDRFMEGQADKIKDSALFNIPYIMELLKRSHEEVTNLLGKEAENFKIIDPTRAVILFSNAYTVEGLSLRIHLGYELYEYTLADLSPADNSVFYQTVEDDTGAVEVLRTVEYIFHYDTLEEKEQILSWMSEQKKALTEYFGRPSDLEVLPDSLGGQWMLDVKGSDKKDHRIAYCIGSSGTKGSNDREIRMSLSTYEAYSSESSEVGLKK